MARRHKLIVGDDGARHWLAAQQYRIDPRDTCPLCQVRGDLGCRHLRMNG